MLRWATQHGLNLRDDSDGAILGMLARAGAQALRVQALEDGYDRLARSHHEDEAERGCYARSLRRSGNVE